MWQIIIQYQLRQRNDKKNNNWKQEKNEWKKKLPPTLMVSCTLFHLCWRQQFFIVSHFYKHFAIDASKIVWSIQYVHLAHMIRWQSLWEWPIDFFSRKFFIVSNFSWKLHEACCVQIESIKVWTFHRRIAAFPIFRVFFFCSFYIFSNDY